MQLDDSLSIELFVMGYAAARDGTPCVEYWPEAMRDGWRWFSLSLEAAHAIPHCNDNAKKTAL